MSRPVDTDALPVNEAVVAVCSRSFSRHEGLRCELLARYPNARFNSGGIRLKDAELREFLGGASKAIVALERIDGALLDALPTLRTLSKFGVGLDGLDLGALESRGIALGWTGGVNRHAVAELVIAQAINLLRGVHSAHTRTRTGDWTATSGRELGAMTVGLIGCGYVGQAVARLLRAFGATVLAHDIRPFPDFYAQCDVEPVDLATLLQRSNIVSLHVPFDDSTRNLMDRARLAQMQPGAILINTARGEIVDETALFEALNSGRLAGAAFDVLTEEPPQNNPLLTLDSFACTPHLAGSTREALLAMGRAAIRGLDDHQSIASHRAAWSS
ncbi:MAG: phosphoglycerate dehydrogenase-like enzyme [Myxococcota bacterium]|jgi:phosphoglycerate dehydrogenase-like enzyme